MKYLGLLVSASIAGIIAFTFYYLPSCDKVTIKYDTYADAKAEAPFARGWIPDVIPSSSTKIIATNDIDNNTGNGEFYFSPDDASLFISNLQLYESPVPKLAEKAAEIIAKGYAPYEYINGKSRWVFFVEARRGHVFYFLVHFVPSGLSKTETVLSMDIPRSVLEPCLDQSGRIAEPNQPWNYSDSDNGISLNTAPRSRLIKACKTKDQTWFVLCEKGGYAPYDIYIKAKLKSPGVWERGREGQIPNDLTKICK